MEYHEFVCAGASALYLVTTTDEPARIPGAAQQCCRKWVYSGSFSLGDGSHSPTLDAAIKSRVAAEGYHLYIKRPC